MGGLYSQVEVLTIKSHQVSGDNFVQDVNLDKIKNVSMRDNQFCRSNDAFEVVFYKGLRG